MKKGRTHSVFCGFIAVLLGVVGTLCICQRISASGVNDDLAVAAAAFVMPAVRFSDDNNDFGTSADNSLTQSETVLTSTPDMAVVETEPVDLHEDETHYPVIETRYGESGVHCSNFYIKDSAGTVSDFESLLTLPLGFEYEQNDSVQVLIYHTHTTESYLEYDEGYYHESFYPRSEDSSKNMISVGEKIAESLRAQGIGVVHATEVHDNPQYTGAYDRSWDTVSRYMQEYPDIKVVIDIHRDSIASQSGGKVKPTFEVNGRKAAQIMIMAGCDANGIYNFPQWEYNLRFALRLQETAEEMYPGMTRPLYFGNFAYNMPISTGSLLIEVGTDVNTLSEAKYTGELLGNVIAKVLQSAD